MNNLNISVPFLLIPWVLNEKKPLSILKKERLTAGDMLQVRKVAKHVYEKLFLNENDKEYDDDYLTDVSPNSRSVQEFWGKRTVDPGPLKDIISLWANDFLKLMTLKLKNSHRVLITVLRKVCALITLRKVTISTSMTLFWYLSSIRSICFVYSL